MVSLKSRKMFTFRMGHVKIFPNICMNFMLLSKVKSGRFSFIVVSRLIMTGFQTGPICMTNM
ncbi:hypothetical protein HanPSC8_Chr03g0123441 [Helianthus annuus]|nr:hypothetical protein HanIR_Chr03g0138051 [Helianthus annuus]KAJ0945032.1 hypothetical protein HanPSC8_Chr03g0123441 [Helianthus annuus]